MPRYKMVVLSSPAAGREAEYNDWYQNVHLADVVAFSGITSAQRFRLARNMVEGEVAPYLAIYEIETDDIDAVLGEMRSAAESGRLAVSGALGSRVAAIYEEFGDVVTRTGATQAPGAANPPDA